MALPPSAMPHLRGRKRVHILGWGALAFLPTECDHTGHPPDSKQPCNPVYLVIQQTLLTMYIGRHRAIHLCGMVQGSPKYPWPAISAPIPVSLLNPISNLPYA